MTGRELAAALLQDGFVVLRRSKSLVWLGRHDQRLIVDENAEQRDDILDRLRAPKGGLVVQSDRAPT